MSATVAAPAATAHPVLPEKFGRSLKADLPKAEESNWEERLGAAIELVQKRSRLSLKEFADKVRRNERQVARWFKGLEHPQIARIFAVPEFRELLIVALAELAGERVRIKTTIEVVEERVA